MLMNQTYTGGIASILFTSLILSSIKYQLLILKNIIKYL